MVNIGNVVATTVVIFFIILFFLSFALYISRMLKTQKQKIEEISRLEQKIDRIIELLENKLENK